MSLAGRSDDPSRFSKGRADLYGGRVAARLLPDAPRLTFGPQSAPVASVLRRACPVAVGSIPDSLSNASSIGCLGGTWHDPDLGRPIAAPLQRCAQLLGVDLATIQEAAANVEPYICADGSRVWSLMQLERQLRPEVLRPTARRLSRPPTNAAVAHAAKHRPDQGDRHLQEPRWRTPPSKNTIGSSPSSTAIQGSSQRTLTLRLLAPIAGQTKLCWLSGMSSPLVFFLTC